MVRIAVLVSGLWVPGLARSLQDVPEPPWLEGVELVPTYAGGAGLVHEHRCATSSG